MNWIKGSGKAPLLILLVAGVFPLLMCHHHLTETEDQATGHGWFPHGAHVESGELACEDCHEGIEESEGSGDNNLPAIEVCLNCHESGDPSCRVCTRDPGEKVPGRYRGENLVFSHKAHLMRDLPCEECHAGVASSKGRESESHLPTMKRCLACHDNKPCERCHQDVRAPGFKPRGHDAFWPRAHALSTAKERGTCEACHTTGWCQECHQGDIETRYHEATFINIHGLEARLTPGRCDTCHLSNFCKNCHGAL